MPPVTATITGATVKFCALNAAMATSFYGNPTANTIQYTVVSTIEFTQSFTFSSNGVSYTSLHLVGSTTDPNLRKMYYIADGVETLVYHNDQWTDEAYKTITFETQSVREGIYGLLYGQTNNINCGVKVQPGTYVWKDNPGTLGSSLYINSFVSGNETFCAVTLNSNEERNYSKITVNDSYEGVDIYTNGAWVDEKYKTITISENCYIGYGKDNDFASLFEAAPTISFAHRYQNSTLIGTGTYKFRHYSVEKPVATYTLEAGTYKWVDVPNFTKTSFTEPLSFDCDGYSYTSIFVDYYVRGGGNIVFETEEDSTTVYDGKDSGGWVSDNYKTITLTTDQTVSAEFYTWAITGGNLVKQTGETWVLNETLDIYRGDSKTKTYIINFVSNGENFAKIRTEDDNDDQGQYLEYYKSTALGASPTPVYHSYQHNDGGYEWQNQAYRTITFSTPPTGDLLTWLQANGTKQGGVTEHTLTFSGVTVTVDGASVTSPYTLTKDCTIVVTPSESYIWESSGPKKLYAHFLPIVNGTKYYSSTTVTLSSIDIAVSEEELQTEDTSPSSNVITIKYTA
mgnify:CR=1 FL=1